jgi:hypothetical protein
MGSNSGKTLTYDRVRKGENMIFRKRNTHLPMVYGNWHDSSHDFNGTGYGKLLRVKQFPRGLRIVEVEDAVFMFKPASRLPL